MYQIMPNQWNDHASKDVFSYSQRYTKSLTTVYRIIKQLKN
jgi:Mor family transcriptional regulator